MLFSRIRRARFTLLNLCMIRDHELTMSLPLSVFASMRAGRDFTFALVGRKLVFGGRDTEGLYLGPV